MISIILQYSLFAITFNCSSYIWKKVAGGQVQSFPCSNSTGLSMVFDGNVDNELITMPLNLTDVR